MSRVTSAVIQVCADDDLLARLVKPFDGSGQCFARLDEGAAGGCKHLENDVYAAGFNYVDVERLRQWFVGLPWERVDTATLSASVEHEHGFVVVVGGGETQMVEWG